MSFSKTILLAAFALCLVSLSYADNGFFIPKQCPQLTGEKPGIRMDEQKVSGCVCYANGTCNYSTDKTKTELCYYAGATSVNDDEQCPILENGSKMYVCPLTSNSSSLTTDSSEEQKSDLCATYLTNGCICYSNGTCEKSSSVNQCQNCRDTTVAAVVEGGDCPVKSENATCKLQNHPNAYLCSDKDRSNRMCPMYITRDGCVCYQDGTCKSAPANKCTQCRDATAISVTEGKNCLCV